MSTLHDRLLVEIERDQVDTCGGNTNSARDDGWWYAHAALRAVVERHAPVPRSPLDGGGFSCPVCVEYCSELGEHTCSRGNVEAPCDEIKVIARELGVEIGETPK